MTSSLKWHGGKHYLASRIVALMPPHAHYVEPYAGGLSVLLAKDPEGVSEVVNDLNIELTNFWACLQNEAAFAEFIRQATAIPFSEREYQDASRPLQPEDCADGYGRFSVVQAVRFFVRCRQSLAGRMDTFAPLSRTRVRRGMNEQVAAWLSAVEGLPAVHARLKRVVILNRPALDVIRGQDGPNTLFYLDPPYLPDSRTVPDVYQHEMSAGEHAALLNVLETVTGKFILSGYRSDLYDAAALRCGWERRDFSLPNNSAGGRIKRRMVECCWTNYKPMENV